MIRIIDAKMHGRDGITGVFVVEGDKRALVESGPKSSLGAVLAGLEQAGVDSIDWIVPTHIHLDHAGAAGTLLDHFPMARVAVHEIGAPHLVDPSKLWSSAGRIYGDAMDRLWGGIDPIPQDKIRTLVDGDVIDLGGVTLRAVETPGHARHHHAFLHDSGVVFTGDAMGVRLPDVGVMRPATPPPEFNLEDAVASIERIRALRPERLCLTHFAFADEGAGAGDVDDTCDRAIGALRRWAELIVDARRQTREVDEVTQLVKQSVEADLAEVLDPEGVSRMEQTTSYAMNTSGYMRYMDKKERATQDG